MSMPMIVAGLVALLLILAGLVVWLPSHPAVRAALAQALGSAAVRRAVAACGPAIRLAIGRYLATHPVDAAGVTALVAESYGVLPPALRAGVPLGVWESLLMPILLQVEQAVQQPPPIPPSPYMAVASQKSDGVVFDTGPGDKSPKAA